MGSRILLVDAETAIRSRVRALLAEDMPDATIEEAETAAEALERLRSGDWAVVILDLRLSDVHGLNVLRAIRAACGSARVVVLTALPLDPYATEAGKLGADAYVQKHRASEDLLSTVKQVVGTNG